MSYASRIFQFDDVANTDVTEVQPNAEANEETNLKLCILSCIATKNKTSKMYNAFKHDEHSKFEREKTIKNALKSILNMSDIADYTESTLFKRLNIVGNTRKWMNSKPKEYNATMNNNDIESIYDVPKESDAYRNKLERQQLEIRLNALNAELEKEENGSDALNDRHTKLIMAQKEQHNLHKQLQALKSKQKKPGFFHNKNLVRQQIAELTESLLDTNIIVNNFQQNLTQAQQQSANKKNELLKQIAETQQRIDDVTKEIPKSSRSNSWWGGKTMRNKRRKHKKTRR